MIRTTLLSLMLVLATLLGMPATAALDKYTTVLVTGANRGIGLELATQLHARGVKVIGTARKPAKATELKALGVRVEQLDVTDAASIAALAERLDGVAIDLLINNAGVGGGRANSLEAVDFQDMAFTFSVNSIGPLRVTQGLLPNLRAGQGKQVVSISSIMGSIEMNQGGYYAYRASKTALNMLNSVLAKELGKQGFTCVVMHPGWVKTRMGGATAPVEVSDSVAGLIDVIDGLEPGNNGQFLDYQGKQLPW